MIKQEFPAVAFGTSGVRALVADLTDDAVAAYVAAFMQRMKEQHAVADGATVAVAMDLRPSSPGFAAVVCGALSAMGYRADWLGAVPTPALALRCLSAGNPGVMVTGSHIPFDRNGIKFYSPVGEILKADEQAMVACPLPRTLLNNLGSKAVLPAENQTARDDYLLRYTRCFGAQALAGLRVGLYQHSAVGRDVTKALLEQLGADVVALGRSDDFVPVDTEAVADRDLAQARGWCQKHGLDAVVSTDGDGDRPLVFDENGEFVRGDLLGLLCARRLGITHLAVPVSCNSAIEQCGAFTQVVRTRIGSPYVIAAMNELTAQGKGPVAGFEANGGFLLGSAVHGLAALPTRDALLPMVSLLAEAVAWQTRVSSLVAALPQRFTHSDRLQAFATERSRELLARVAVDKDLQSHIAGKHNPPTAVDATDGVRMTFTDGDIVHLRASGNAPELRCYAESATLDKAKDLCQRALSQVQ